MANGTLVGVIWIAGAVPLPESKIAWGLPVALSAIVSVADFAPVVAGVKLTVTVVLAFGTRVIGVVAALKLNSLALVPVMARLLITRLALPLLVIWTVFCVVVVVSWLP